MKTGIIGLPQVGKTSLFGILTKAHLSEQAYANPREAHLGVAKVPDDRLDRLAALYSPKKLTHASVEYVDVGAIGQDALKETAYLAHLRGVDALAHVLRAFDDPAIPHVGSIDPLRDIKNVEFDLMVSDLGQIEKRLERLEKDLKKMRTPGSRKRIRSAQARQRTSRIRASAARDGDDPRGQKAPARLHVPQRETNSLCPERKREHGTRKGTGSGRSRYKLTEVASRPNAGAAAICGKVEAELAEMSDADAAEFLSSYGLTESGLVRLIRTTYTLLGLISFFTAGEDECRAWTIPVNTRAQDAAGAIHSDLQKHFIRAETIRWDQLLDAGSEANARARGTLRLEGKDYIVQDGDVMHIRHSG